VNEKRDSLLNRLDQSIAEFATMRTPEPVCTAAFDTLKQARAMIARALTGERDSYRPTEMSGVATRN
jgi:hypothetical protein